MAKGRGGGRSSGPATRGGRSGSGQGSSHRDIPPGAARSSGRADSGRGRGSTPSRGGSGGGPFGTPPPPPPSHMRQGGPSGTPATGGKPGRGRGTPGGQQQQYQQYSFQNRTSPGQQQQQHGKARGGFQLKDPAAQRSYLRGRPQAAGMPNPYVFVELEGEDIWKVAVPGNQRFSMQFLAGIEAWAAAMASGAPVKLMASPQAFNAGSAATTATVGAVAVLAGTPPPPPPPAGRAAPAAVAAPKITELLQPEPLLPPQPAAAADAAGGFSFLDLLAPGGGGAGGSSAAGGAAVTAAVAAVATTVTTPEAAGNFYQVQREEPAATAADFEKDESADDDRDVEAEGGAAAAAAAAVEGVAQEPSHGHVPYGAEDALIDEMEELMLEGEGEAAQQQGQQQEVDDAGGDSGDGEEQGEGAEEAEEGQEEQEHEEGEEGDEEDEGEADYDDDEELDEDDLSEHDYDYGDLAYGDMSDGSLEDDALEGAEDDEELRSSDDDEDHGAAAATAARRAPAAAATAAVFTAATSYASAAAASGPAAPHSFGAGGVTPPRGAHFVAAAAVGASTTVIPATAACLCEVAHAGPGRLRVSLHLERQALTDSEVELLARWYKERASHLIELSKLWLFDNRIGEEGARCIAASLFHPALREVHLSHNFITTDGAAALLAAVPTYRPSGLRPLWLRLEWNLIGLEALHEAAAAEQEARGLRVEVPEVVKAGEGHNHEMNLKVKRAGGGRPGAAGGRRGGPGGGGGGAAAVPPHVQLPWVQCQKQAPSEASVLRDVRSIYQRQAAGSRRSSAAGSGSGTASGSSSRRVSRDGGSGLGVGGEGGLRSHSLGTHHHTSSSPSAASSAAPSPPLSPRLSASPAPTLAPASHAPPPPPPPPPKPAAAAAAPAAAAAAPAAPKAAAAPAAAPGGSQQQGGYVRGPLLIFPDTSALISMLGANIDLPKPALTMSLLSSLAESRRFGRALAPEDQAFIVISDSVMKQLDGLKAVFETRGAVRKFLSEGLERMGPAGLDFVTVLGAHEGEGLLLEGGALGAAGSNSPFVMSKGQQVDYKIVEVALYFMKEVQKASPSSSASAAAAAAQLRQLPVLLLSNDNAQIMTAKAHGLPAFRLASMFVGSPAAAELDRALEGSAPLTSGVLRSLLAPAAVTGLGSTSGTSLQEHFDSAVATLRAVNAALGAAAGLLQKVAEAAAPAATAEAAGGAASAGDDAAAQALAAVRALLHGAGGSSSGTPGGSGGAPVAASLSALAACVESQLGEWEGVVRSRQQPSRLLKWAAAAAAGVQ